MVYDVRQYFGTSNVNPSFPWNMKLRAFNSMMNSVSKRPMVLDNIFSTSIHKSVIPMEHKIEGIKQYDEFRFNDVYQYLLCICFEYADHVVRICPIGLSKQTMHCLISLLLVAIPRTFESVLVLLQSLSRNHCRADIRHEASVIVDSDNHVDDSSHRTIKVYEIPLHSGSKIYIYDCAFLIMHRIEHGEAGFEVLYCNILLSHNCQYFRQ